MAINVRKLPKILQMPEAKNAFLSGGFKEAEKYIVSASQTIDLQDVSEYSLIDELCQRLEDMDPAMASRRQKAEVGASHPMEAAPATDCTPNVAKDVQREQCVLIS